MKILKTRLILSIILLITGVLICCKNTSMVSKTTISLISFKKATLDTGGTFTQLKILKIYPAKMECDSSEKYANLYICKEFFNGDTIYVFEECKTVPKFALDTGAHHIPIIDTDDVLKEYPNKAIIFVPIDFKMPNNAKFLFAKLSDISES
jgi:hypothetical protein